MGRIAKYVTRIYKIWFYSDRAEFFYTRDAETFNDNIKELDALGYDYYYETERELHY